MPRSRAAVVNAVIAALVGVSGVVVMLIAAPAFALWIVLAALFVTIPPILIVVRDIRDRGNER